MRPERGNVFRTACASGPLLTLGLVILIAGCAPHVNFPSADTLMQVSGFLYRPDGARPFPAMVLIHHCAGVQRHVLDWAAWLKTQGYVALVIDSLGPRGSIEVCSRVSRGPSPREATLDAFGALVYLRSLPFVDGHHVGVIGWLFGGEAAWLATSASVIESVASNMRQRVDGFRAAVAFYPWCGSLPWDPTIPVLMLLGEADDWTGYEVCVAHAKRLQESGKTVLWKIYPGAYHSFDDFEKAGGMKYLGSTMMYDPVAASDARNRVREFLAQQLRTGQP